MSLLFPILITGSWIPPPSQRSERQVEITLNEYKYPLSSQLKYRRSIWPNHIKFISSRALAPMWTPPISESAELKLSSHSISVITMDYHPPTTDRFGGQSFLQLIFTLITPSSCWGPSRFFLFAWKGSVGGNSTKCASPKIRTFGVPYSKPTSSSNLHKCMLLMYAAA